MKKKKSGSAAKDSIKKANEPIRLNKFLAESGLCSRRKADEYIESGVVKVNRKTVKELGTKVKRSDFVTVNGDPVGLPDKMIYILLNKPKNIITTTKDELNRQTVLDIVRKQTRIFPVGRLDRNTTGVLLLTNDGDLANKLTHPRYEVPRTYNARLDRDIDEKDAINISKGIELDDGPTGKCQVFIHPENRSKVSLTLSEGRNHEVKRIFEKLGYEVKSLDRKFYATLSTKGLKRGEYRHLLKKEVLELKKMFSGK